MKIHTSRLGENTIQPFLNDLVRGNASALGRTLLHAGGAAEGETLLDYASGMESYYLSV